MNLKVTFLFVAILTTQVSVARHFCSRQLQGDKKPANKATIASPDELMYDVHHLKFDIALSNINTSVSGNVTTTASVVVPSMDKYTFELSALLTIDSFKFNGQLLTVQQSGFIRTVNLPAALSQGTTFSATVYYHGQPTSGTGFFTAGLNQVQIKPGIEIMYTLSDIDLAKDWWPSKQSITDKIDSADIWITVPDGNRAGSNGLLRNVTDMPGNQKRFEWKTNYPIDYYLISVAVGPYADYSYTMQFTDGTGDIMPIQNYVYDSAAYLTPERKGALDSTGFMVDYFSKLFGKYPFYKEKYGHCIAEPLNGGMEHQTMTTLGFSRNTMIAHELGHQWWGDHVTYGTWHDIWLSEGFASYCEQLFIEHFHGKSNAKTYRGNVFDKVITGLGTAGGSVYVYDTTSVNRIFDGRLTYNKGASVTHMLRYMAPQDEMFFDVLRQYQQQYAFGNAITPDLQAIAEQVYGIELDSFFNQWIYGEGYPTYSAKWYQEPNSDITYVQLSHTSSKPSSVSVFNIPVEVKLRSAQGDTVVRLTVNSTSQNYTFSWGKKLDGIEIDPDDNIMNKVGTIAMDPSLHITSRSNAPLIVYPNPASSQWRVNNVKENTKAVLLDAAGKRIWSGVAAGTILVIPATGLPTGVYLLKILDTANNISEYKLVK